MFSHGKNTYGGLGTGEILEAVRSDPVQISMPPQDLFVGSFSASPRHTVVLGGSGQAYVWGSNGYGQLCQGKSSWTDIQLSPIVIANLSSVVSVAATERTTILTLQDGSVWGCGVNDGPLSTAVELDSMASSPVQIISASGLGGITAISVGSAHVLALDQIGRLWAWGDNTKGQLGIYVGHDRVISRPALVSFNGTNTARVVKSFASGFSSAAIMSDGSVFAWGCNSYGKLGLSYTNTSIYKPARVMLPAGLSINQIYFAVDGTYTMFLMANTQLQQAVYAAGLNRRGALMSSEYSKEYSSTPILCTDLQQALSTGVGRAGSLVVKHTASAPGFGLIVADSGSVYRFATAGATMVSQNRYLLGRPSFVGLQSSIYTPANDEASIIIRSKDQTVLFIGTCPDLVAGQNLPLAHFSPFRRKWQSACMGSLDPIFI
jgi:alpha-tubulin suppressor-like RCC1 family protein